MLLLFILFLWHSYTCYNELELVDYYAKGMSEYAKLNNDDENNLKKMKKDTIDEFNEFFHELREWKINDAFYELLDIWHCLIKFVILYTPFIFNEIAWKMVAFIIPFYCIEKHALRYKNTGCIRSIKNHVYNVNHKCAFKLPLKKS